MYRYLRGIYKGPTGDDDSSVVIDVGGVGFEVILPPIVEQEVAVSSTPDSELTLYVSTQAGRDQPWPTLFGFLRPQEKAFWELLKTVPRLGGKGAAKAMVVPIDRIAEAIQDGNRAFLDGLPGITVDGADKMIAALRKKVAPFLQATTPARPRVRSDLEEARDDAIALLAGPMGVKRVDAQRAVDRLLADHDDITTVQDIIDGYFRAMREGASRAT
jgi:Holliday junction resolvasome RuvABC DNA-binding subunit